MAGPAFNAKSLALVGLGLTVGDRTDRVELLRTGLHATLGPFGFAGQLAGTRDFLEMRTSRIQLRKVSDWLARIETWPVCWRKLSLL